MSFLNSFDISASGMSAQRVRMDIAAENIANVDTTRTEAGGAYKRKDVVLESFENAPSSRPFEMRKMARASGGQHSGVRVQGVITDDREMKRVYNPNHPDADAQGYVNYPNVDILKETVDSMSATRSYEANVTALNAMKTMAQRALDIGK